MNKSIHTIVIADDHLLIAKALSSIIEQFRNFETLYEVENGAKLVEKFNSEKNIPDIVLLDISMPVMDGFETAEWLRQNHPAVLVMTLTMQADDSSLMKMIRKGAHGYLHKNVHPLELEKALNSLVEKKFYYPDWATSRLLHNLSSYEQGTPGEVQLSAREKEFLRYVCTEMTYKEIGEKMFCSPRTVESYRDTLFEKLGVKTKVALALFAVKVGLHELK
ncbi:MAG: response regulator transcription factor, partial [Chitinophagaceae bacterium]